MAGNNGNNGNGKTTCKEVCTNCKCTVIERPLQPKKESAKMQKEEPKKDNCVATIVGVLSLPDNFCCGDNGNKKGSERMTQPPKDTNCNEVYRDLGECLQKCIVQSSKETKNGKNGNGNSKSNAADEY